MRRIVAWGVDPLLANEARGGHSGSLVQVSGLYGSDEVDAVRCGCCTLLLLRHEAQCYIARAAGRDERRYLWI